jgi:hypothetical protein
MVISIRETASFMRGVAARGATAGTRDAGARNAEAPPSVQANKNRTRMDLLHTRSREKKTRRAGVKVL